MGPFITMAACALFLLGVGACGDDNAPPRAKSLTASELTTVQSSRDAIRAYCRRVGLSIARGEVTQLATLLDQALAAADRLGELARAKPAAHVDPQSTTYDVLADTAEDLDGTNCSPAIVQRLERGLAQSSAGR
jgi:hypothetical protein